LTRFSRRLVYTNNNYLGCGNVEVYSRFEGKFCCHLQDIKQFVLDNTVSHLKLRLFPCLYTYKLAGIISEKQRFNGTNIPTDESNAMLHEFKS
jgi:hypothetical protein